MRDDRGFGTGGAAFSRSTHAVWTCEERSGAHAAERDVPADRERGPPEGRSRGPTRLDQGSTLLATTRTLADDPHAAWLRRLNQARDETPQLTLPPDRTAVPRALLAEQPLQETSYLASLGETVRARGR